MSQHRIFFAFLIGLVSASNAVAQTPHSARDGIYTSEQASRGESLYSNQCASCHGKDLGGGDEAPLLAGDKFLVKWGARSVWELDSAIQSSMPADRPGTLSPQQTADIVAYMLSANKFPPGKTALSGKGDALKQIALQPASDAKSTGKVGRTPRDAQNPFGDAEPMMVEGRPIERRPPEKGDDKPAFPEQTRAPYKASPPFKVTTLIDRLAPPWSLAFLPDGKILITEKFPGKLRILDTTGILSAPIGGVSAFKSPAAREIGLLDVVVDANFATNQLIFVSFFDFQDDTDSNVVIARAKLDEKKEILRDTKIIFRAQPAMPSKRLGAKTGGRMVIAPDGSLFVTIGDRSDSPPWDVAQRLGTDLGKIIHITTDGAPSPDNPFIGIPGALPEIWAYGTRSQEGLAFDPKTGRLWEHEHGPRGGDELNIIEKGKNYGWPVIVHGIDYPGTRIGQGITHQAGMEEPVYYWDPVIAPSGLAFYRGALFPQWQKSIFVGGLRAMSLERLTVTDDRVTAEEPLLTGLKTRIRDVRVGPDGAVYVLTDSGTAAISADTPQTSKLLKLTPQ